MTAAPPDSATIAARWIAEYCATSGDVLCDSRGGAAESWRTLLAEIAGVTDGDLEALRDRVQRQADDIGTGYRMPGDSEERPWPVSPLPLLIAESEWTAIAEGVAQRARLMELLLDDIYGAQQLTRDGLLPASLVTGNPYFLRPMVGLQPPGGRHLSFYAVDLARGPDGEWRVLGDHLRAPVGAGYALGMTYGQVMGYIVLPQAFRNMLPVLLTQTIILFQDTSLVYVLSITDFLGAASKIANRDFRPVEMYLFAAVVYFAVSFTLSSLVRRLQTQIAIVR